MIQKNVRRFGLGLIAAALVVGGCGKKAVETAEAVPVVDATAPAASPAIPALSVDAVQESERSAHFVAVSRQLELGGTLYGYVDIDGDAMKMAAGLGDLMTHVASLQPQAAPYLKQDYAALFAKLGFNDVKAIGLSSVPDGTGFFRNRVFFYTPESRHGLLAGLGGNPAGFTHVRLAPADADVFAESELDVPAVYATLRDVIEQVGGEEATGAFDEGLRKAGESAAISFVNLINGMKGHASFVMRFDVEKNMTLPGPNGLTIPAFSWLLCVDGIAQAIEPALARSPVFAKTEAGGVRLYELQVPLPLEGIKPVIAVDGGTFYVATSRAFLSACREQTTGLGDTDEFKQALAHVGVEGNGLSYVSPRAFARLRELETMNVSLPPETKGLLRMIVARLPQPDRPLVTVRTNLPDGILVRSYMNRSMKQELVMAAMYNPVSVGLVAAMAIPAFQKVRMASQEKAVLNNLRQLGAAADQYYLEHGVATASFDDLVGPDRYIRALTSVAGEEYRTLHFAQGEPLRVVLADGRPVEYQP